MKAISRNARIACCHGGELALGPVERSLAIDGASAVLPEDILAGLICGCSQTGRGERPCARVVSILSGVSSELETDGGFAVTEGFRGITDGVPPGTCSVTEAGTESLWLAAGRESRCSAELGLETSKREAGRSPDRSETEKDGLVLDLGLDLLLDREGSKLPPGALPSALPVTLRIVQGERTFRLDELLPTDGSRLTLATGADPNEEAWVVATSAPYDNAPDQLELAGSSAPFVAAPRRGGLRARSSGGSPRWMETYGEMIAAVREEGSASPDWKTVARANELSDADERRLPAWFLVRVPVRLQRGGSPKRLDLRPSYPRLVELELARRKLDEELARVRSGTLREDLAARLQLAKLVEDLLALPELEPHLGQRTAEYVLEEGDPELRTMRRTRPVHALVLDEFEAFVSLQIESLNAAARDVVDLLLGMDRDASEILEELERFLESSPLLVPFLDADAPSSFRERSRAATETCSNRGLALVERAATSAVDAYRTLRALQVLGRPKAHLAPEMEHSWNHDLDALFERFLFPPEAKPPASGAEPRLRPLSGMARMKAVPLRKSVVEFVLEKALKEEAASWLQEFADRFRTPIETVGVLFHLRGMRVARHAPGVLRFFSRGGAGPAGEVLRYLDRLDSRRDLSEVYQARTLPDLSRRNLRMLQRCFAPIALLQVANSIGKALERSRDSHRWDALEDLVEPMQNLLALAEMHATLRKESELAAVQGRSVKARSRAPLRQALRPVDNAHGRAANLGARAATLGQVASAFDAAHAILRMGTEIEHGRFDRCAVLLGQVTLSTAAVFFPVGGFLSLAAKLGAEAYLHATAPNRLRPRRSVVRLAQAVDESWLGGRGWNSTGARTLAQGHGGPRSLLCWNYPASTAELRGVEGFALDAAWTLYAVAVPWNGELAKEWAQRSEPKATGLLLAFTPSAAVPSSQSALLTALGFDMERRIPVHIVRDEEHWIVDVGGRLEPPAAGSTGESEPPETVRVATIGLARNVPLARRRFLFPRERPPQILITARWMTGRGPDVRGTLRLRNPVTRGELDVPSEAQVPVVRAVGGELQWQS